MRFLLDMGVHLGLLNWLRDQGHEVIHLRDEGLGRLPDGQIFAKGIAERRIVVTFDLDFGEIASYARGQHTSVILFRLRNTRVGHVIHRLSLVLEESSDALTDGAVIIVEDGRHRIRRYAELS